MAIPTLPTELLVEIFSSVSSPSDLYHSLQASKQLAKVVRPFLYHHITIQGKEQRERLKNVRDEDKKLVKNLTIKDEKADNDKIVDDPSERYSGSESLRALLVGDLLDLSVITILHVKNVSERPWQAWRPLGPVVIARSLTELSISRHHGGAPIWETLLEHTQFSPYLEILSIYELTEYGYHDDDGQRVDVFEDVIPPEHYGYITRQSPLRLSPRHQHLKAFAAENVQFDILDLKIRPLCLHFVPLDQQSYEMARYYHGRRSTRFYRQHEDQRLDPTFFDSVFSGRFDPPTFLSFPFPRSTLNLETKIDLNSLEQLGTEVHFDEEEDLGSTPFIPQHFVDYVARMKRLKLEQEAEEIK